MVNEVLRRSEVGSNWLRWVSRFAFVAARRWFEWVQWVLILAVFQYLAHVYASRLAWFVLVISGVLLWLCFSAFFFRLGLKGSSLFRAKAGRPLSMLIAEALSVSFWFAAQFIPLFVAAHTSE
jgi:hypothetical protein